MKKGTHVLILCWLLMFGCSTISPYISGVATTTSYPTSGKAIESGGDLGSKEGRASAYLFLGIVAFGDASVTKAARNAGITQIKTIDFEYESVLALIYGRYTTVITGD